MRAFFVFMKEAKRIMKRGPTKEEIENILN